MNYLPLCSRPVFLSTAAVALALGLAIPAASAVDYTWSGGSGAQLWSTPGNWSGGPVPNGTDPTANLIFGGNVGAAPAPGTSYIATNDIPASPFLLNRLTLQATDAAPATSNLEQTLAGNPLRFTGASAQILQNGTAAFVINNAIQLGAPLTLGGAGSTVTLNGAISGTQDIIKNGASTFRFGSLSDTSAAVNAWFGTLTINDGTVRFNNNARTAPTALRSNPVNFGGAAGAQITTLFKRAGAAANQDPDSSLRLGTLNGTAGLVEARRSTSVANALAGGTIVITALADGVYGGNIRNIDDATVPALEQEEADFIVRGIANQTLNGGTLQIAKDVIVGRGATLTLRQAATLSGQASGAIVVAGGTFVMDNTMGTIAAFDGRLRNSGGTGLETVGGGKFSLIGNATTAVREVITRLQLGSAGTSTLAPGKPRSGALTINVTKPGTAATSLTLSTYLRDGATAAPANTVDFTANDGTTVLGENSGIGISGNPRILFTTAPVLFNSLIGNNDSAANASSVGWATVNGSHFATYNSTNGVQRVSTSAFNGVSNVAANQLLDAAGTMAGAVALNSLRIAPTALGFSLSITGSGNLNTNAIIHAGDHDYAVVNTGGGTGGLGA
ncbi:MAG: hypothetical protein JWQ44_419, partial [Chthoniobacter sp.]|nr:hypothetical protein [Chthoniobacter sp.]